jgi:hypothetical protein
MFLLYAGMLELTPSGTKPQGIVRFKWTAFNQRGEANCPFETVAYRYG